MRGSVRYYCYLMLRASLISLCFAAAVGASAADGVDWIMRGFNQQRTGANKYETVLNQSNVNAERFGKLFSRPVDGQIYSQPLVVSQLNIPGRGTFSVVYVATMHDTVYAFDAENPANGTPLWQHSFLDEPNGVTTIPYQYLTGFPDIHPEVGIVSTMAIDLKNRNLFVLVRTLEGDPNVDSNYHQRLYAMDMRTGYIKKSVELSASVAGQGNGNVGGVLHYSGRLQNQRPALVLANGKIYIASASHGDNGDYHGWVLAYDSTTLAQTAVFCTTPNGGLGGIWMSGQGMPVDNQGNLYFATGNGTFDPANGNYGDSFVKLRGSDLQVLDYFTPYNQADLEAYDADLGSCGPVLIPETNLLVGGSKESKLYAMDTGNMGHFNAGGDTNLVEWWWAGNGHIHGSPIYWAGPNGQRNLYLWSENDRLKAFRFNGTTFDQTPFATSSVQLPPGMPGGFLTASSNAKIAGTGIIWATVPYAGDANWNTVPGILRAFRADDLTEIWNSRMFAEDDYGDFAKFNPPVVANGRVYVATFSNQLSVYGLLPSGPPPTPKGLEAEGGNQEVALTWKAARTATTYELQRGPVGGPYQPIATIPSTSTMYVDKPLNNGTTYAYVVYAKNAFGQSQISNEASATPVDLPIENGTGITGNYYNDPDSGSAFSTLALKRKDPTIDYDWGGGSPAGGVQADHFSVIWTGFVEARTTGTYQFRTITDDGVRLWVKGAAAIDNWTDHAPMVDTSASVLLVAGRKYPIQMELYENGGGAVGRLYWKGPGDADFAVIPKKSLFPNGPKVLPVALGSAFNLDGISYGANPTDGDMGIDQQTLSAELLPMNLAATTGNVQFDFPVGPKYDGALNILQCTGSTLRVPATPLTSLLIAGMSIGGTQGGTIHLNYSDGSVVDIPLSFTDWSAPSPRNHEKLLTRYPRRHSPSGDVVTNTSLYQYTLDSSSGKVLVSITLPVNDKMKILSLAVR